MVQIPAKQIDDGSKRRIWVFYQRDNDIAMIKMNDQGLDGQDGRMHRAPLGPLQ